MKRLILAVLICFAVTAALAQTQQTATDYVARRLQIPLLDAPQKAPNASVSVSGNPGPATYYYWIITNALAGASSPAGPFQIGNAPNTLTGANFNQISWLSAPGAITYDVLRTSTQSPPAGVCNCAVATAVATTLALDQSNSLNAYTVSPLDISTLQWIVTTESVSVGVSQISFRVGGVLKFSIASSAAAGTGVTPFSAPAHQFLISVSAGGIFSSAQPASTDLSDAASLATASSTNTFTNKNIDAEGAGNTITIPVKVWLPAAGCNNATASTFWDLPTATPAAAACVNGTNTQKGVLDFADTAGGFSAQNTLLLPSDFTGNIDARIIWLTTATAGNAKWSLSTICTDVSATAGDDPAFNTASTVTTAAPGTANRLQTSSIAAVTITGCSAGQILHAKLFRDGADAADTITATARLYGVELTIRRSM